LVRTDATTLSKIFCQHLQGLFILGHLQRRVVVAVAQGGIGAVADEQRNNLKPRLGRSLKDEKRKKRKKRRKLA
jgi:hypothetical protein